MSGRGPFVLMCLVVLFSATGSSARDSGSTRAVHLPSTDPPVTIVHSRKVDLPWPNQADISERQMLAWIILLMKDGRAAR
jgi:hypothetical protein